MHKNLLLNYNHSVKAVYESEFYRDLTPQMQYKVMKIITENERIFFNNVFSDDA